MSNETAIDRYSTGKLCVIVEEIGREKSPDPVLLQIQREAIVELEKRGIDEATRKAQAEIEDKAEALLSRYRKRRKEQVKETAICGVVGIGGLLKKAGEALVETGREMREE